MSTIFVTEAGLPVPSVSSAMMAEIDRRAIHETGPGLLHMMENAGRNMCQLVLHEYGQRVRSGSVLVLAGTGGNGGGGVSAARHLAQQGATVSLCLTNREGSIPEIHDQLRTVTESPISVVSTQEALRSRPSVIVDAMVGYSLHGPLRGITKELADWMNDSGIPVVSLDVPSGLHPDTGVSDGVSVRASKTLTLALPKSGLCSPEAGEVFLADIGLPDGLFKDMGLYYQSPFAQEGYIRLKPA